MVDYNRFSEVASRLIKNNGRSISLIRLNETPDDPQKPWKGPSGAETTVAVNGVFVPPNTVRQFGLSALGEGTEFKDLVSFSEQIIIVSQGDEDIRKFTSVLDGGVRWGIIGTQVLKPGTKILLGFIGVRR